MVRAQGQNSNGKRPRYDFMGYAHPHGSGD
jgi:hypothetical protein